MSSEIPHKGQARPVLSCRAHQSHHHPSLASTPTGRLTNIFRTHVFQSSAHRRPRESLVNNEVRCEQDMYTIHGLIVLEKLGAAYTINASISPLQGRTYTHMNERISVSGGRHPPIGDGGRIRATALELICSLLISFSCLRVSTQLLAITPAFLE